jgi:HEAT repeat protein
MLAILQDGGPMRYHVIRTLGRLESRAAAEPLEHLYAGSPLYEKIEIVSALVRITPPGIIGFLRARLEEPEVEIRRVAIYGLARMAGPAELPLLVNLAQDPDWTIRNEVAVGLGLLASTEGRPALLELSRDLEPVVARTARNALAALPGGGLA